MTTRAAVALCGGALVIAAAILGALAWCGHQQDPLSPETRREIDSLHATKHASDSTRQAEHVAENAAVDTATTAHQSAVTTRTNADVVKRERDVLTRRADSLAAVARARDSLDVERDSSWRFAYDAEHLAKMASDRLADSLAKAADSTEHAYQLAQAARVLADASAAADSARADRAEHAMDRAATDAEHAGECRVLWVIPCPSRKVAVVAGAVVGAVGTVAGEIVAKRAKQAAGR